MANDLVSRALDGDITMAHQRIKDAVESRLPSMPVEMKERYFAVLSAVVTRLEDVEKSLQEILRELMSDPAMMAIVLQELGRGR